MPERPVVESWSWTFVGLTLIVEFGLAAILVPDMRRRRVQWWWQGLILLWLFPSSVIWFALVERQEQRRAGPGPPAGAAELERSGSA